MAAVEEAAEAAEAGGSGGSGGSGGGGGYRTVGGGSAFGGSDDFELPLTIKHPQDQSDLILTPRN